jgi:hypothetical protein
MTDRWRPSCHCPAPSGEDCPLSFDACGQRFRTCAYAPDLLAACRLALPLIDAFAQGRPDVADALRAAIALADGQDPA